MRWERSGVRRFSNGKRLSYPRQNPNSMTGEALIFGYVVLLLAGISILAIYSELRGRRFQPARDQDRVFRCECGSVYTDDPDVERSRCTQCGRLNGAIEF